MRWPYPNILVMYNAVLIANDEGIFIVEFCGNDSVALGQNLQVLDMSDRNSKSPCGTPNYLQ